MVSPICKIVSPICSVYLQSINNKPQKRHDFYDYESALSFVTIRLHNIYYILLDGKLIYRNRSFINYDNYLNMLNCFQDKNARTIAYRVIGPYHRSKIPKELMLNSKK